MTVAGKTEDQVLQVTQKEGKEDDEAQTDTDDANGDEDNDSFQAIFASPTFNPFKIGKAKNAYNSGMYFDL